MNKKTPSVVVFLLCAVALWWLASSSLSSSSHGSGRAPSATTVVTDADVANDDNNNATAVPFPPSMSTTSSSSSSTSKQGERFSSQSLTLPGRSEILHALFHYARDLQVQGRSAVAKFSSLNRLFAAISLKLPDASFSPGSGLDITITRIVCRNLSIRDVRLSHEFESNTSQRIDVNVDGLEVDCTFRWGYGWTIFNGGGSGRASLEPSSAASVSLRFHSEDYATVPPHDASVPRCEANVRVDDESMNFDGDGLGIIGGMMNLFKGSIANRVEDELGDAVCGELGGLGDDALDDLLTRLSDGLEEYLVPLEGSLADPMHAENTLVDDVPTVDDGEGGRESAYVNFRELDEYAGEWIDSAFDRVDSFLGLSASSAPSEQRQLGINEFVRDNFLDDDGGLVLDPSYFFDSGVVFEGHDMLTQTTISVESIRIEGLDSFEGIDLLNAIGKHTLRNRLELTELRVELEMEAEMRASSRSDAIVVAPNSPPVTEQFAIDFSLGGIEVDASIFLGVDARSLGDLQLGSLLHSKNVLPCLFSAIDVGEFTGLSVSVSDIVPPDLNGFIDGGIDHLVSAGAEALFEMYERVLIRAMPNFFQTYVRDAANDFAEDALGVYRCPVAAVADAQWEPEAYLDFRDLFLPPAEAALVGGAGDGRHGDVVPWVMNIIEDQLFSEDDSDGLLAVNRMLVGPLTKSQSGTEGALKLDGTLFEYEKEAVALSDTWKAFADNLRLTLSDLHVTGLDTLRGPVEFLEPAASAAHLLSNRLNLGIPGRPLDASVRFGIEVGDAASPLATNNVLDLRLGAPAMEALAEIFATVRESRLTRFPLKDVLNFSCWLSMIPVSGADVGLAVRSLNVLLDGGITARTSCVSCSNTWLREDFDSMVDFLAENGFVSGLQSRALSIASDLSKGDWAQVLVDQKIAEASRLCPHDAAFGSVPSTETSRPRFEATRDLVDGILYAALPLVQVASVVVARTHSDLRVPLSPVAIALDAPDDANLVDLTDMSGWADVVLNEARNYLGGDVDGSQDIGITNVLKSLVLDSENLLTIPMEDMDFELGGVNVSFIDVTIAGLDSFTIFDVLKTSGPNALSNSIKLQTLGATLKIGLSLEDESSEQAQMLMERGLGGKEMDTIAVSLTLKDVELDLSLLMAMDQDLMGELKLGSILDTNHIFSCLLSTIHSVGLSEFVMDIGDIEQFSISGFISQDTRDSIRDITEAIFEEYKPMLLEAVPALTSITIRPILHDIMQVYVDTARDDGACPEPDSSLDGPLDFRDLLFSEERASELLGRGDSPYGDLFRLLYGFVEDLLFSADENGLSTVNDLVIAPLTKSQSGVEGALKINGTLLDLNKEEVELDIWKAFADNLRLTLSDLSITGLDTLRTPVKMLKPRPTSAHLLDNQISLGIPSKPLDASVRFGIEVGGAKSPLATNNVLDLHLSMPSLDAVAAIFATIQESRFLNIPLKDVLNFSCWLSMIPVSEKTPFDVGLAMHHLYMLFDGGIMANTACVSCSNNWLREFNSIIGFLTENDFVSGLMSRAVSIASDLLKGDWIQGMVDEQITAASQRCPHDSMFGSLISDQKTYPTFKGTRDLVDGILYAGFPLVQVIAVVIAQKHFTLEIPSPANVELDVPDGAALIDLTDLSSVAGWADMALEEVRYYLGRPNESKDLGITSALQSTLLDENGLLTIAIEDEGFDAGGVKLSLYNVTMVGLDSFTIFDVLKVSDPNRFSNSVKLQQLGVTLRMGLSVEDDFSEQGQLASELDLTDNGMETITVSLMLKDVEFDLSLLMAMDQDLMGELKLGSILDTNHIFSCLFSTIRSVGLPDFVMAIGDIEEFSISGFISQDTSDSIQSMTEAIFEEYKPLVVDAFPAFTSNTIRPILHDIIQVLVATARDDGTCPEPGSSQNGIVDFRDLLLSEERALDLLGQGDSPYGGIFRLLYTFLEDLMSKADENGLSQMNNLLASLTERQSNEEGGLYYPGDLFSQDLDIALNGLNAAIELGVSDLRVSNIDTLGAPVKVLQPMKGEPSILNNTASIGAGPEPFRTEFRLLIKGKGDDLEVHNDLVLGLSLENVDMMLEVLAQIAEAPFLNFPLQDLLNLQCWLATAVTPVLDRYGIRVGEVDSGIVLKNLALAVAEARLDIECISCSSPLILEMSSKLDSHEAVDDVTAVANMVFEYLSNLLGGNFVQSGLDKMLNEAAMQCPHSPSFGAGLKYEELIAPEKSEDSYGFLIAIFAVIVACTAVFAVVYVGAKCMSRRRHIKWVNTLSKRQKLELQRMQNGEREREKDLNSRMTSLVRSKEVPLFLRLFIPVVIIGNIALFLSGHLSVGGTVNISGSFAGQEFDVQGFFEFSMAKSTIEMWNAGATALAILIVIFSGVWPYSKLLITLFIWFAPPRWLSSNRRGKLLHWLDVLGKWSMVDVFVLLMTLASFQLSVASPDHLNFLPEGLYSINMLVVPLWGLYANMLAQFVAQISSHTIIHYHRKTVTAAAHSQEVDTHLAPSNLGNIPEKLWEHKFKLDYEVSSERAVVRRSVHWVLSTVLLLFMLLVICGCALPSFGIEVLGLVGLVVESGNQFEQAQSLYSVFDLATMITDQARYLNTASDLVGLGTLASLLVITVFLVPLAQATSLLAQWFAPMTKKQRMWNTVLTEILDAWQYMEVYVLSIIIAAWQLGGVSEYMINAYCDPLESTFSSLSYYGILREDDAQCFRVDATVESASWILVAASVILYVLKNFIMGASTQKALDDDIPTEQRLHTDRRWRQSKQSTVTAGIDMSMTRSMSNDDEEAGSSRLGSSEGLVSPVRSRFTDYYFFATTHRAEDRVQSYEAETAILPIQETEVLGR